MEILLFSAHQTLFWTSQLNSWECVFVLFCSSCIKIIYILNIKYFRTLTVYCVPLYNIYSETSTCNITFTFTLSAMAAKSQSKYKSNCSFRKPSTCQIAGLFNSDPSRFCIQSWLESRSKQSRFKRRWTKAAGNMNQLIQAAVQLHISSCLALCEDPTHRWSSAQ